MEEWEDMEESEEWEEWEVMVHRWEEVMGSLWVISSNPRGLSRNTREYCR
jgi:hypothetical protein